MPTYTPRPEPTATPEQIPTARPTPTRTPHPNSTPRPTLTPTPPSLIAGLENGSWLERNKQARANEIKQLPWVADGVDDSEREATELLIAAALWYPNTFRVLVELPWVRDNITGTETQAIYGIRWAVRYNAEVANRMLQKSWVRDDITVDEATAIRYLHWMGWYENEPNQKVVETIIQIMDMPFLQSVEGADAMALRSLERLEDNDQDAFLEIMSHPNIEDGITDEEAKIVALLGSTYKYRPQSVDFLLRGTGVYLEERFIELPFSGETLLAVIRIRDQATPSMDYLEHSVRTIEEFMGEPFPTSYIALFFDDATVTDLGGTNYSTHITMSLLYDVEYGRLWKRTPFVIAHEVAHYYWTRNSRDWVDEGPAELLGSISEKARIGTQVEITNNPCASAKTIAELESMAVMLETWADTVKANWFRCNYSLGEQLFLDLYNTFGEEAFRQGFRSLYLKSQLDDSTDECEGTNLNICHVAAAFKANASPDIAAKVDEIIARWYGPLP